MSRFTVMGFSPIDVVDQARLALVREASPEVDLRLIDGPLDERAVLDAVAAGDPPDLIYLDRDLIGRYAALGSIVPLNPWIEREQVDLRQFRDTAVRHVSFRNAMYGLPEYNDVHVLVIHLAALASALLLPGDIEFGDWIRMPEANRELTSRLPGGGLRRAGVDAGLPELLPVWAKANGAELLSADGRTAQFEDPRVVEALETAMAVVQEQGGWTAVEALRDTLEPYGPDNPFARDQLGAMVVEGSYVDVLAEHSPYLEIAVKPVIDRHAIPLTYAHGMAWAIPTGARDPERAFAVARAMTAPDTWVAGAQARRAATREAGRRFEALYTANKVADHAIWTTIYEPSGVHVFDQGAQVIRSIQETGFVVPTNGAPQEVRAAWITGTNRALRGLETPARALERANRRAQAALDAAR
jgi:multiple sugar transport system substrate-binding protein